MTSLPATYKRWLLTSRPDGDFTLDNFKLVEEKLDSNLKDGEILVKVIYLSMDPTLINWASEHPRYTPQIKLGSVMNAIGLGRVVASKCTRFAEGDLVTGITGFQEYSVMPAENPHSVTKVNDDPKYPLHIAINNFGITGLSAYFGLLKKGEPKEGETLLVSGASGATGLMAGCIGKIKGCRVVGIAGSDEKCKSLTEKFKFDGAINYKIENVDEQIKKLCPKGVDIFFDNVGGVLLDTVFENLAFGARIVICGAISQYGLMNKGSSYAYKNLTRVLNKEAQVRGFFLPSHRDQYGEAAKQIHEWLEEGKLESMPVTMTKGIDGTINALLAMFKGQNIGKALVEVCSPPSPFHD